MNTSHLDSSSSNIMTSLIQTFQEHYKIWQKGYSPDVDSWFLMDTPLTPILILIVYLVFVLKIGPALMKNRKGMELRNTLIGYNGLQVVYSAILVWMSLRIEIPFNALFSPSCSQKFQYTSRTRTIMLDAAWWYHFSKVTELLDTLFFVLRKKQSQVTFLHVYHHTVMVFYTWLFLKYSPGETGAIIGTMNSSVHVIMYTYYMIAAMGPAYQKYIWWKKYMTVIQLAQFCIIITYMLMLSFSNCGHTQFVTYFFIVNALIFLYLFLDFYRKSYSNKSKAVANGKSNNHENNNTKYVNSNAFIADNETYSRITKDVAMLDKAEKYRKAE